MIAARAKKGRFLVPRNSGLRRDWKHLFAGSANWKQRLAESTSPVFVLLFACWTVRHFRTDWFWDPQYVRLLAEWPTTLRSSEVLERQNFPPS